MKAPKEKMQWGRRLWNTQHKVFVDTVPWRGRGWLVMWWGFFGNGKVPWQKSTPGSRGNSLNVAKRANILEHGCAWRNRKCPPKSVGRQAWLAAPPGKGPCPATWRTVAGTQSSGGWRHPAREERGFHEGVLLSPLSHFTLHFKLSTLWEHVYSG